MNDWLVLPGEELSLLEKEQPAAEKNLEAVVLIAADHDFPPPVSQKALVVAEKRTKEQEAYLRAWSGLTLRQQVYMRALQQSGFSVPRALKILNEAIRIDPSISGSTATKHRLSISAVRRWAKDNANFRIVLATLKAEAAVQVTSRDDLLLRAHRAAEYAEEEQPILHQGEDTGFRERKPDVMLRANEQLMKATKVLGEDNRVQIAVGPALVVQVVQGDGSVKDVTPRGVVVDLPQP